MQPWI